MGAAPIGNPGCPEFAFSTASMLSVRMVLIQTSSIVPRGAVISCDSPPLRQSATASSPDYPCYILLTVVAATNAERSHLRKSPIRSTVRSAAGYAARILASVA